MFVCFISFILVTNIISYLFFCFIAHDLSYLIRYD